LARRAAGLTQADLARQLGVSRSAVAQWERPGGSKPVSGNLEKLAVTMGCSFEWLATGRGNRHAADLQPSQLEGTAVILRHFARDDGEEHLLALYRELDGLDQRAVQELAEILSRRSRSGRGRVRKE
jgi:transcriptional regulator with XRE-family HTH domain